MAVIKYDVSGIEPEQDRGVMPAGVYKVKIITCVDAKPSGKDRRLEVVGEVVEGDWKGFKVFDYINLEVEDLAWKLAQFVRALALPDKGGLDPKKVVGLLCRSRTVVQNSDDYGMQSKHRRWLPLDADEGESADSESAEDDEDATEDDETEDDSAWTEEELKALALKELETIATEAELDTAAIKKGKTKAADKKAALVTAILAAQEAEDEDGDEEGDELWTEEELGELDDDDLKAVLSGDPETEDDEGLGLDPDDYTKTVKRGAKRIKKFDRDGAIAAILEAQEAEDEDAEEEDAEEEAEEEEADEAPDYDSMELDELKALAKERSLKTQGTKKILVARLKKADEPV